MDVSIYNKKGIASSWSAQSVHENIMVDKHSSSKAEFGNIFPQDFCNKLRLEISPAVIDINLLWHGTQSSNEDGEITQRRISEVLPKDAPKSGVTLFTAEALELSLLGSFILKMVHHWHIKKKVLIALKYILLNHVWLLMKKVNVISAAIWILLWFLLHCQSVKVPAKMVRVAKSKLVNVQIQGWMLMVMRLISIFPSRMETFLMTNQLCLLHIITSKDLVLVRHGWTMYS